MLYFSETAWTLPDIADVNQVFDRDYDQAEYEKKIGLLVRNICADDRERDQVDAWRSAVDILRTEDHYLLVLIDTAGRFRRGHADLLKLLVTGLALGAVVVALAFWASRL